MAYGRLRQPDIYTSSDTRRDLTRQLLVVSARAEERKLARQEKKDARSLILLAEQFNDAKDELRALQTSYDKSSELYLNELDALPDLETTTQNKIVTEDLNTYYIRKTEQIDDKMRSVKKNINTIGSELFDVSRVKAGLSKISLFPDYKAGPDLKGYDLEDLSVSKVAKVFNIDEGLVSKLFDKQPEIQKGAVGALNAALIESLEKIKERTDKQSEDRQKGAEAKEDIVSSLVANAPFLNELNNVAASDLNEKEMLETLVNISAEDEATGLRLSIGEILSPKNSFNPNDTKDQRKDKMDNQLKDIQAVQHAFKSFSDNKPNDIVGLGRFIKLTGNRVNEFKTDRARKAYKTIVFKLFNVDLDAKSQFIFEGYTLTKDGIRSKKHNYQDAPVEDLILSHYKDQTKSRAEYMKEGGESGVLYDLIKLYHPHMTAEEIGQKLNLIFNKLPKQS